MGFLRPLNFSVEEKPMDSTETEMSVLVLCNFRVSSTLTSDFIRSRARLHICCLLVVSIPNVFNLLEKKIVSLSLLGTLAEAAWALRSRRLDHL